MTITELPQTMRMVGETTVEMDGQPAVPGWLIANDRWETLTRVSKDKLAGMTVPMLEDVTAQGKNVDHISRVTGYFSKISGWNPGKAAELKDRHRSSI